MAAPPSRRRRNWVPYALLLPGLLWLIVFFVLPMVTLGSQSLQEGNVDDGYVFTANFGIYVDAIKQYWPQFMRSFVYAGIATGLALLLGYPLAYFIARRRPGATRTSFSCSSSRRSSPASSSARWPGARSSPTTGSSRSGRKLDITDLLQAVGLTNNDSLLNSQFAVIMGLTYNFLPFMILPSTPRSSVSTRGSSRRRATSTHRRGRPSAR